MRNRLHTMRARLPRKKDPDYEYEVVGVVLDQKKKARSLKAFAVWLQSLEGATPSEYYYRKQRESERDFEASPMALYAQQVADRRSAARLAFNQAQVGKMQEFRRKQIERQRAAKEQR